MLACRQPYAGAARCVGTTQGKHDVDSKQVGCGCGRRDLRDARGAGGPCPGRRRASRRDRDHRAEARAEAAGRADRGQRGQRRTRRVHRQLQHRVAARARAVAQPPQDQHLAEPVVVPARRRHHQLRDRGPAERRHGARRRGAVVGRRGLRRSLRCRAHRGAARPAGHVVRQERLGRRGEHRHQAPRQRVRRLCRPRLLRGRRSAPEGRRRPADLRERPFAHHGHLGRLQRVHQQRVLHRGWRHGERLQPQGCAQLLGFRRREQPLEPELRLPQVGRQLLRRGHRHGADRRQRSCAAVAADRRHLPRRQDPHGAPEPADALL